MEQKILFGTGVSSTKDADELYILVSTCIKNGIRGFDTAPSYRTEKILGNTLNRCIDQGIIERKDLFVQTKIDGWQMQEGHIEKYVRTVLDEMKFDYLDSVLIHWPFLEYLDDSWNKLVHLKSQGLIKQIGICNLRKRNMIDLLDKSIIPEIVQIERNPLNTMKAEIEYCIENNILIQAYSPLCKMDERIKDSEVLKEIAEKYDKNVGQIVLRWQLDTGVAPIFTSRKEYRILEYADIFSFHLNKDEIKSIETLNQNYKLYLESFQCPGL